MRRYRRTPTSRTRSWSSSRSSSSRSPRGRSASLFAGTRDAPRYVGLANYIGILTARGGDLLGHGSFYLTLLVTLLWTLVNVFFHVSIGLVLGVALSRPVMHLRAVYRVILILPWAVPSYVTALAWKGMFQRQFGAVNLLLRLVGVEPVSWFSHFTTAAFADQRGDQHVWLGFPFMMVGRCSGALHIDSQRCPRGGRGRRRHSLAALPPGDLPLLKPVLLPRRRPRRGVDVQHVQRRLPRLRRRAGRDDGPPRQRGLPRRAFTRDNQVRLRGGVAYLQSSSSSCSRRGRGSSARSCSRRAT